MRHDRVGVGESDPAGEVLASEEGRLGWFYGYG